ncbi:cyanate lyase [Fulvimarina manganoxydans]|uniref:Cyanate hydratase n=1 Tax=Fulvimarina manganoxydans TaxID=937218 RepID=A0A1W2CNC7_9HYPH|nr:cyanase [Fulvimarina manganoxydans]SMC86719.1 cyanate lyase [Fulvimarina manganoxydans]
MIRSELTEKILDVKREKDLSWKAIAEAIGGYNQIFITTALLGDMPLPCPQAAKAAELFGLTKSEEKMLTEIPMRGRETIMPPQDPTLYRFYEAMLIFGPAMKETLHEEFGDGIMSAIDYVVKMEREPDPAGDRVKITMSGKFLPYKYHEPKDGAQASGARQV